MLTKARGDLVGLPKTLLAFDPGGTTGYAVFKDGELVKADQVFGSHKNHLTLLTYFKPDQVVMEDYVIYSWALKEHRWSRVPTLRFIGGIESQCRRLNIPVHQETAQAPKGFMTDAKLKAWGLYKPGHRHANDAIRHGCYYLAFKAKHPKA